jgi:hypothetical protein
MEALVYRPVFLELARLTREGRARPWLSGQAFFFTDEPLAAEALLALWFWLCPKAEVPTLRREGQTVWVAGEPGAPLPTLTLTARPALPGQLEPWRGTGLLSTENLDFEFAVNSSDSLFRIDSDGVKSPQPLAEGDARHYSALDEAECAAAGRESQVLPRLARERIRLLVKAEGLALAGVHK